METIKILTRSQKYTDLSTHACGNSASNPPLEHSLCCVSAPSDFSHPLESCYHLNIAFRIKNQDQVFLGLYSPPHSMGPGALQYSHTQCSELLENVSLEYGATMKPL